MGQVRLVASTHGPQLQEARQLFFDRGELPEGLVDPLILRSWERCRRFGLTEAHALPGERIDVRCRRAHRDAARHQ